MTNLHFFLAEVNLKSKNGTMQSFVRNVVIISEFPVSTVNRLSNIQNYSCITHPISACHIESLKTAQQYKDP